MPIFQRRPPPDERLVPQTDEEYLAMLVPEVSSDQSTLALELRRTIGAFAGVESKFVRADATFDDLDVGPKDSINELDFLLRIETVVGRELTKKERVQIPNPDLNNQLKVGTFVKALCQVIK